MSVTLSQATSLLENVLFESPTLAALNAAAWVTQSVQTPTLATISGLAAAMSASAEAGIAEQVVRYYEGALGRNPGGSEVAYYVAIAEQGLSAAQIAQGVSAVPQATWNIIANDFAASPEFNFDVGGGNVVTLFYVNILGRAPAASEIAFYQAQLSAGLGLPLLVQEFVNSPEYQSAVNPALISDLASYGSTVLATGVAPATLGVLGVTGETVTLTTGKDAVSGTTFNGTVSGSANASATLQAGDSLTGVGSSATLNLSDAGAGAVLMPLGITLTNIHEVDVSTQYDLGDAGQTAFDLTPFSTIALFKSSSAGSAGDYIKTGTATDVSLAAAGGGGVESLGGNSVTITSAGGAISVAGEVGTVTVTSLGLQAQAITVDGGTDVTVTANGATTGTVTVGGTLSATGTVSISETNVDAVNGGTTGAISVTGGRVITVSEAAAGTAAAIAGGATTITLGKITITGDSETTSVSVMQSAPTGARAQQTGAAGVVGEAATAASPGVTGVRAVTAVAAASSVSGALGVADGAVIIADASHLTDTTVSNSIASVSLTNAGAGSQILDNALTSLTLAGTTQDLTLVNAAAGAATNTSLNLILSGATVNAFTDANNEITSLNIETSGTADSVVRALSDSQLATISVTGERAVTLKMALAGFQALKQISVSGDAGFGGDLSGISQTVTGTVTSGSTLFSTTSSGTITLTLDQDSTHQQSFFGAAGRDVITLDSDVESYAPVDAGQAASNELVLVDSVTYTLAGTGTHAVGFTVLGVVGNPSSGTANVLNLSGWQSSFTTLDILAADASVETILNFAGSTIDLAYFHGGGYYNGLSVSTADGAGASDVMTVLLSNSGSTYGTPASSTVSSLTLSDGNGVGIGSLVFDSENAGFNTANSIISLVDNGLAKLTLSGSGGLSIVTLSETTTPSTQLAINNGTTNAAGLSISNLNDNALASLTITGSAATSIGTLHDASGVVTLANNGTASLSISQIADNSLVHLTLTGTIALGQAGSIAAESSIGLQDSSTAGVTVSAASDNAHVTLILAGAGAGNADAITLGNGNNDIVDSSIASTATVSIAVGSGSNLIVTGTGVTGSGTSATFTITLASHSATAYDAITVGPAGVNFASAPSVVITGISSGDQITLSADSGASTSPHAVTTSGTSIATTLAALEADRSLAVAHGLAYTTYNGNTFIAETVSGTLGGSDTTVIELTGLHGFTSAGGLLTLSS